MYTIKGKTDNANSENEALLKSLKLQYNKGTYTCKERERERERRERERERERREREEESTQCNGLVI